MRSTTLATGMGQIAAALLLTIMTTTPLHAQTILTTPGTNGDQLIFFYDAREGRVPFIVVGNFYNFSVVVETAIYSRGSDGTAGLTLLATEVATIQGRGQLPTIDPTDTARFPGMNGTAGLVVVTAIVGESDTRPVATQSPFDPEAGSLYGGFTLANLNLSAGFGQNPFGRIAVDRAGRRAAPGTIVDGTVVRYQRFAPESLVVPFYFNPQNLSPPANDGNRVILAAFADGYDATEFRLETLASPVQLEYILQDAHGATILYTLESEAFGPVPVSGVHFDDLQNLADPLTLTGPGKLTFLAHPAPPANANVLGLFSQALGTFSVGQRMPGTRAIDPDDQTGGGTVPCDSDGPFDVWSFPVATGENLTITADTVSDATAGDLRMRVRCARTTTGLQNRNEFIDDSIDCTFPPPNFGCPQDTFTATEDSICTVTIEATSTCADQTNAVAAYALTVTPPRTLTLTGDGVP